MKNFKKVISVVMALAMIISSFTAVSASKFADVADTAKYAEAVQVLSALGVVNGIEENGTLTFKPENLVTRAEAATMIVGALNMANDANASAGTSQFADVNSQAAWAAGFVNVGVAQGFIAGYDANTFGPLDNVTYAQLCVMLTQITGYGEYAKAYGGWPTGYTTMAATAGINKGVAAANDTALTRGQVAMMVWNALKAPMLGVKTYTVNGNEYEPLDGSNGKYKTLFSEKFDGYTATITIKKTPLTEETSANDEVTFDVEKSDWWLDKAVKTNADKVKGAEGRFAADVDVNGNYLQTGEAVFVLDEEDEVPVMIYFAATGKVDTKEVAADTYYPQAKLSDGNKYANNQKIRFGSTYYKFDTTFTLFVNGVEYATIKMGDDLDALLTKAQGTIKLVKADDADYYNTMFINYYQIAEISSIKVSDDETTINLKGIKEAISEKAKKITKIVITNELVEDGETVVTVTKNGAAAELSALSKGDIIAYATNFADIESLEDPKVIDIIATDDVAAGLVKKADDKNNEYTIDETVYAVVDGADKPTVGQSLNLVLDPFGRIYASEADGTTTKYAIVLKADTDEGEVTLLLADGTSKTYEIDSASSIDIDKFDFAATEAVENRVVTYKVKNSNGKLSTLEKVTGLEAESLEYKERTGKLGSAYAITESTPVIDATEAKNGLARYASSYSVFDNSAFVDGTNYSTIAIKKDGYVAFVVITEVGNKFGAGVRFAVVKEAAIDHIVDGDECDLVKVLYNGAEEDLLFNDGVAKTLAVGDAFFFETDSDGLVKAVYEVYSKPVFAYDKENKVFVEKTASTFTSLDKIDGITSDMLPTGTKGWSYSIWDAGYDLQLAQGVVTKVTDDYVEFASLKQIKDNKTLRTDTDLTEEGNGVVTYTIDPEAVAYVYLSQDGAAFDEEKLIVTDVASISASDFSDFENEDDKDLYENIDFAYANEALVMLVNGDIVAIYVIEK